MKKKICLGLLVLLSTVLVYRSTGLYAQANAVTLEIFNNVTTDTKKGDLITHTLTLKNTTSGMIENSILSLSVPEGMNLESDSIEINGEKKDTLNFNQNENTWDILVGKDIEVVSNSSINEQAEDAQIQKETNITEDGSEVIAQESPEQQGVVNSTANLKNAISANETLTITFQTKLIGDLQSFSLETSFFGNLDGEAITGQALSQGVFSDMDATVTNKNMEQPVSDDVKSKTQVAAVDPIILVTKISDGSEIGSYANFNDAYAAIATKGDYKIQFLKDYSLNDIERANLNKFLMDRTTSYVLSGIQKDGKTISKVTMDGDMELGGASSTQGNLIEHINLNAAKNLNIYAGSVKTTFGEGITVAGNIVLLGGKNSPTTEVISDTTDLTVKSGKWYKLIGGGLNNTITGDVNLTMIGTTTVSSYYAAGGANTLNDEHIGEVKGMSNITIGGNASLPVTYIAAMTPIGLNTTYGANINGLNITIQDDATITGNLYLGAYSYYGDSGKATHKAYYNYKGAEVHIKDNAMIKGTIGVESRMLAGSHDQWDVNGNQIMAEDCNVYVEDGKEIAAIGSAATSGDQFHFGGKMIVNVNSDTKIKKIINVDEIKVGSKKTVEANIDAIAKPNISDFPNQANVSIDNGSKLQLGTVDSFVNNMSSHGDMGSLSIGLGHPLHVGGTFTKETQPLKLIGKEYSTAADSILIFDKEENAIASDYKSTFGLQAVKDGKNINLATNPTPASFEEDQPISVSEAIEHKVVGTIVSDDTGLTYTMEADADSSKFSVDTSGNVAIKTPLTTVGTYPFTVKVEKDSYPFLVKGSISVKDLPTNPIKWKVVYKDDATNSGVIMPLTEIRSKMANTALNNNAKSFTRNGVNYANAYLASDLADWTYHTFADGFSSTVKNGSYSDEQGKQLLRDNPYLADYNKMSDYTTSDVYNLPYTSNESYSAENATFTYPKNWISIKEIATAHGHPNIGFTKDADPLLSNGITYFGSSPNTKEIQPSCSDAYKELVSLHSSGALYDPFYHSGYGNRPAVFIKNLGSLEESETFSLGATHEKKGWSAIPEIKTEDFTYEDDNMIELKDAKTGRKIGSITTSVADVTYKIQAKDAKTFSIDADGTVKLAKDISSNGEYTFIIIASKGIENIAIKGYLNVQDYPTNTIKWKVVYKDAKSGSGVIMPVDAIKKDLANTFVLDNNATEFTRDGKNYANSYLASDLANWTYQDFAYGFSLTSGNTKYSDAKGQSVLNKNAYLANAKEMRNYTTSSVYNLPLKNGEVYSKGTSNSTYPSIWTSITEIAAAHHHENIDFNNDSDSHLMISSAASYFGSTPSNNENDAFVGVVDQGSLTNIKQNESSGYRPAVYVKDLGDIGEDETFALGACSEDKGWSNISEIQPKDVSYKDDGPVCISEAFGRKIGNVKSSLTGLNYKMQEDEDSAKFSVDADGNVTMKVPQPTVGIYPFTILVQKGNDTIPVKGSLTTKEPSNPIKWKVIYKDMKTNSGVIMPVDSIRDVAANKTAIDNTSTSFMRDGQSYANGYLASDLADWTYRTFAYGFSTTVGNNKCSDAKGQQVLKDNAYLSNISEMSDYTKSNVYNLPYTNSESYTTSNASFTYPSNWISTTEIATAHGQSNIAIRGDAVSILKNSTTYFGSTPNAKIIQNSGSTPEKELLSIKADGSVYNPNYTTSYGYRPAVYIKNLGALGESETFTLGAIEENKGWSAQSKITDEDMIYEEAGAFLVNDEVANKSVGRISSMVGGVTYEMQNDADSAKFSVDASGNITLNETQTTAGTYPFTILAKKGDDTILVKRSLLIRQQPLPKYPIKWKVIYRDRWGGKEGTIMPVDYIRQAPANSTRVDNTATSFKRDGKDYANGYLASDLADWTYHTFALGFSATASDKTYSDVDGQQILKNNPYLTDHYELSNYKTSKVYNLTYERHITYSTPKVSFTYPWYWDTMRDIGWAEVGDNVFIGTYKLPVWQGSITYFGSSPNIKGYTNCGPTAEYELMSIGADGAIYNPSYSTSYGYRPAIHIDDLSGFNVNDTFFLGATEENKGWVKPAEIQDGDASYTDDGMLPLSEAVANKKVGSVTSKVAHVTYGMKVDADSDKFSVDENGNVTLKNALSTAGTYPFTILVNKGSDTISVKGSLTVKDFTSPIKWKVIYKDSKTGSGVILPVDFIRRINANASEIDNTVTSFTRNGKDYANGYLSSDLADWTYNTFAVGFSATASNTSFSDAKGQQLLKDNPNLTNSNEMKDYTKSNVYNLPYKSKESYTTPKASFTYPSNWISITEIATAHGHGDIGFGKNPDSILSSSGTFFGSTPNSTTLQPGCSDNYRELISLRDTGALYDPYYHSPYGNRPAVYIENLGALEENETFSLGATDEAKGWSATSEVKDGDATYTDGEILSLSNAVTNANVGAITSTVADVTYSMKDDTDSAKFNIDGSGNVTLKGDIIATGNYPFTVLVKKGVDTILVKGSATIGEDSILITNMSDGSKARSYSSFKDANIRITNKDVYKISFTKDYTLDATEGVELQKFLTDKTSSYSISGVQKDGSTISTVTIDGDIELSGNPSIQGNLIENIKLKASKDLNIYAGSVKTTFGDGITTSGSNITLLGGKNSPSVEVISDSTDLTVKSGSWYKLIGGGLNNTITKDANLTITGTTTVKSYYAVGGANTLSDEHVGEIKGMSNLTISGTVSLPVTFATGLTPIGVSTAYGANINGLNIVIEGDATIDDNLFLGAYTYYGDAETVTHKAYYNYKGVDVYIKDNATIKGTIGAESRMLAGPINSQWDQNNKEIMAQDCIIHVDGGKEIAMLGSVATTDNRFHVGGDVIVDVNSDTKIKKIINVDEVNVGNTIKTKAMIDEVALPNIADFTTNINVSLANDSSLTLGAVNNTINDLTSTGNNTLILSKPTSTSPLNIDGKLNGDKLTLDTTGTDVAGDVLLKFTNLPNDILSLVGSGNSSLLVSLKKADNAIVFMKKGNITGSLSDMHQKDIEHIDDTTTVSVKKDIQFNLSVEDADYVYGTFIQGDAKHSDAYVSTSEIDDATWLSDDTVPANAYPVVLTNAADNTWTGSLNDLETTSDTCYYLHVRDEQGEHMVTPIDVNGVHASVKAGSQTVQDTQGLKYQIQLQDTHLTSTQTTYAPSGIAQAAFSLNANNQKALEPTFQGNIGTADEFYGIQTWNAGNSEELYEVIIPENMIQDLKRTSTKIIYVYAKDMIGNTTVSSIYIGDDLMNVNLPTKASVIALKGNKEEIVAPMLDIYNFGAQKVNVKMSMKGYADQANTLRLVDNQTTYASDEFALSVSPILNTSFMNTNIKKIKDSTLNLGDIDILHQNADSHHITYTFTGAYDAQNIDSTLQENVFTLEYHLTPMNKK